MPVARKSSDSSKRSRDSSKLSGAHRSLVEIASIELAYARAEIELSPHLGEACGRIAAHLASASRILDKLASQLGEEASGDRPRPARAARATRAGRDVAARSIRN